MCICECMCVCAQTYMHGTTRGNSLLPICTSWGLNSGCLSGLLLSSIISDPPHWLFFFFFFTIKIDLTQFCVCGCMCHTMSVNGRIQHVRGGFPTTWVPGIQLWSPGVAGNLPLLNDPSLRLKEGCTPFGDRQGYSPLY